MAPVKPEDVQATRLMWREPGRIRGVARGNQDVQEVEAACKAGHTSLAARKAKSAMAQLN